MPRMTKAEATELAARHSIPLDADFFSLSWDTVERVKHAADERKYRAPKDANGSRARYFHEYLRRAAGL